MNDWVAKGFVLVLAIAATALIAFAALAGDEGEEGEPQGRWRRFQQKLKALGERHSGRNGRH